MPGQTRLFNDVGMERGAIFSECRRWRYQLWRIWDRSLPSLAMIGLNPSRADEFFDDNTVRRGIGFARRWDFGQFFMLNAYGWRSTDPHAMKLVEDPIGPLNDYWIEETALRVDMAVAAWGIHDFMDRGSVIRRYVPNLYHLGLTKEGFPKHPLYLAGSVRPILYVT